MNDIEKAIEWFELRKNMELGDKCERMESVALAALREKQEREKGCELCNPDNAEYYFGGKLPNYCPMCGRKLVRP